ncbi:MAG: alpha/beta hydrolase [Myxococcota bacterium]
MSEERVLRFGPGEVALGGIWTAPDERARTAPRDDLAVLLLNAGLLHKVGPYRMNVALARALAARGLASFRFDFSGLGDSPAAATSLDYGARCRDEIAAAMDHLAAEGRRRFVVLGLCSGAVNAHRAAAADARAVGVVALDGFAWPTRTFYLRHYGPRVIRPSKWVRFARRKLPALGVGRSGAAAKPDGAPEFEVDFPPRAEVAVELRRLVARGCRMLYVFTGGVREYFNYRGQLGDCFPGLDFRGHLDVDHYPDADHTFTALADRRRLFARLEGWLDTHFPA